MEMKMSGTPEEIARLLGDYYQQWTPVELKTPETADPVIIARRQNGKLITGVGMYMGRWQVLGCNAKNVEYWRPLPSPPVTLP